MKQIHKVFVLTLFAVIVFGFFLLYSKDQLAKEPEQTDIRLLSLLEIYRSHGNNSPRFGNAIVQEIVRLYDKAPAEDKVSALRSIQDYYLFDLSSIARIALVDESDGIAEYGLRAVGSLRDLTACNDVIRCLKERPSLEMESLKAVAALRCESAVELLASLIEKSKAKKVVALALASLSHPKAKEVLIEWTAADPESIAPKIGLTNYSERYTTVVKQYLTHLISERDTASILEISAFSEYGSRDTEKWILSKIEKASLPDGISLHARQELLAISRMERY